MVFPSPASSTSQVDNSWKPVYSEREHDPRPLPAGRRRVAAASAAAPHAATCAAAYDAGATFCYVLPKQPGLADASIVRERTEFRLPSDGDAWATYTAQGPYAKVPVSQVKSGCERPLVVRLAERSLCGPGRGAPVDYARMKFGPLANSPHPRLLSHPADHG